MNIVVSRQPSVVSGAGFSEPRREGSGQYPLAIKPSLATSDRRLVTDDGTILIALLWILSALAVIALSFSRETFVEVAAARNSQSLESAYFIARGGIDSTIYQLLKKRSTLKINQPELQDVPDPLDLGLVTGNLGGGEYKVDIQDESGKINVKAVQEEQLRKLTEVAGIPKPDSDIITDSILDWIDPDKDHRLNGAEDDYYQALNPPYKAKNGPMDTVEELLLIRGVTPEYFYGHPERDANGSVVYKYGLSRYLTVYTNRNRGNTVNVNFAPLPVLLSIPGMTPEAAKVIYDRRHVKPFKSSTDIAQVMGVAADNKAIGSLSFGQTGVYTLTASAHAMNSKAVRVIRAVISLEPVLNKQYRILYWNENVTDYGSVMQ